jgi:nitrile hydratase subunit beta
MRGYHDIGGDHAGPVPKVELPWQHWEKKVEAIRNLLGDATRRVISLDELRLAFETFGIEKYRKLSFYRRRLEAMIDTLEKKGLVSREELEEELARTRERWQGPCAPGTQDDPHP